MITPSFCFSKRRKLMYANFHSCSYVNDNFISSISERFNTKPIILFSIIDKHCLKIRKMKCHGPGSI